MQSKQVQQTVARHWEAKDWKGHDDGEFLSRFYRDDRLRSSLRSVLGFIKYFNSSDELDAFFTSGLRTLDVEAARVIKACANTEIEIDEKAKVIDVCKAEREMREKARLETLKNDVRNVMEFFKVGVEEAMKALKVGEEDQAVLMKMI